MQKKFIINLFFLIGINLLVKPFWIFGIDRTVQNVVGAADYGLYFAVMNFSFLFGFMLDFGLTGFNNRSVAQHEHMAGKYTGSILGMKSALALFYALISFVAAFLIGYDTLHFKLLIWLGINQILSSFILFLRSNISGMQMFKTDSLLSVLDRLLMIVFFSVLLWGNVFNVSINIFYFASFQTLSYLITFLIALFIVLRKIKLSKIKWNTKLNIVLFRQSLPFAVLTFLMLFYYRVDSVMIERLLPQGSMHAGIYASAYRILDAFGMFSYFLSHFASFFQPPDVQKTGCRAVYAAIGHFAAEFRHDGISSFTVQCRPDYELALQGACDRISQGAANTHVHFYSGFVGLYFWNIAHGLGQHEKAEHHCPLRSDTEHRAQSASDTSVPRTRSRMVGPDHPIAGCHFADCAFIHTGETIGIEKNNGAANSFCADHLSRCMDYRHSANETRSRNYNYCSRVDTISAD